MAFAFIIVRDGRCLAVRRADNGLALNRFRSDVLAHVGEIETALGADPRQSVADYVQASFEASLL